MLTWQNLVQKGNCFARDRIWCFLDLSPDVVVLHLQHLFTQSSKLVKVGGKEAKGLDLCSNVSTGRALRQRPVCPASRKIAHSEMAHARPNPSYVDVPRPSSSMMMSEFAVALLRIAAVSSISAMNVDTPLR